jgi:hypothetical protein
MWRFVAGILVALLALTIVAQVALPAYLGDRAEHRLEEGGGRADVSLSAVPAVTLLVGSGKSIEVEGSDLVFDLEDAPPQPFDTLDGFDRVDLDLEDVEAGPLRVERFELSRDESDEEYRLSVEGTTTPAQLAEDLGSRAGGAIGGFLGEVATDAIPGSDTTEVPLELTATLRSDDGRPRVVEASGSVAGIPAGPLTEFVVSAVLDRL